VNVIPRIAVWFGYAAMLLGLFFVAGAGFLAVFGSKIEFLAFRDGYSASDAFLYGICFFLLGFVGSRIAKRELGEAEI
jgi:hypothetical protein